MFFTTPHRTSSESNSSHHIFWAPTVLTMAKNKTPKKRKKLPLPAATAADDIVAANNADTGTASPAAADIAADTTTVLKNKRQKQSSPAAAALLSVPLLALQTQASSQIAQRDNHLYACLIELVVVFIAFLCVLRFDCVDYKFQCVLPIQFICALMLLLPCAAVFAVRDVFLLIAFIPSVTLLLIPHIWTMGTGRWRLCALACTSGPTPVRRPSVSPDVWLFFVLLLFIA